MHEKRRNLLRVYTEAFDVVILSDVHIGSLDYFVIKQWNWVFCVLCNLITLFGHR